MNYQAQNYPYLSSVNWYGSDGTSLDSNLLSNAQAAQFAIKAGFPSPFYARGQTEKYESVENWIQEKTEETPNAYAVAAYDALWVATEAYLSTGGTDDIATLKRAFITTTNAYYGATGWTALNEAGDRKFGNYEFWAVREESDGAFLWARVARYESEPGLPEHRH